MSRSVEALTFAHVVTLLAPHGHNVTFETTDGLLLDYCVTATTAVTPFQSQTKTGWLDVVTANRPRRDETRVPIRLTQKRRALWTARAKARGSVYVLVRLRPATSGRPLFSLLEGARAADDLDNVSVDGLLRVSVATWENALPTGNELARWLVS